MLGTDIKILWQISARLNQDEYDPVLSCEEAEALAQCLQELLQAHARHEILLKCFSAFLNKIDKVREVADGIT